jgi:hypothetical protein
MINYVTKCPLDKPVFMKDLFVIPDQDALCMFHSFYSNRGKELESDLALEFVENGDNVGDHLIKRQKVIDINSEQFNNMLSQVEINCVQVSCPTIQQDGGTKQASITDGIGADKPMETTSSRVANKDVDNNFASPPLEQPDEAEEHPVTKGKRGRKPATATAGGSKKKAK